MAYRNKAYLCFDGDNDIHYYRLMKAWDAHENFEFAFNDAHEMQQARDSSQEETIKRSLRERMNNSNVFIVLIGKNTKNLYKFVRWEMEIALKLGLPIIAVNLNKKNGIDFDLCPAIIRDELVVHVPWGEKTISHALKNWPSEFAQLKAKNVKESRNYSADIISKLAA